jgi:hypothetical protein
MARRTWRRFAIGVVVAVVVFGWIVYYTDHEIFLIRHHLISHVYRLGTVIQGFTSEFGSNLGPDYKHAIRQLYEYEGAAAANDSIDWSMFLANRDPWGNRFVFIVRPDHVVFGSMGENGRDDGGKGDDIYVTIEIRQQPATTLSGN